MSERNGIMRYTATIIGAAWIGMAGSAWGQDIAVPVDLPIGTAIDIPPKVAIIFAAPMTDMDRAKAVCDQHQVTVDTPYGKHLTTYAPGWEMCHKVDDKWGEAAMAKEMGQRAADMALIKKALEQ